MKYTELADNEEFYHKVEYYNKARTEKLSIIIKRFSNYWEKIPKEKD